MKRIVFIIFFHFYSFLYAQQNLVPNFSFEQKIKCITHYDQFIGYVADWTGQGGNGEALSWCTAQCAGGDMPDNWAGHQYARSGNSYALLSSFVSLYVPYQYDTNFRNYVQVELISPLEPLTKYCVVFYVSLSDTAKYACNDIGAYFSDSALYNNLTCRVKSNFIPQIANDPYNNPLIDKVNWTAVAGSFIADGGEKYIVIGNFKDDFTSVIDSVGSKASNASYPDAASALYYIDDVFVEKVIQAFAGADSVICRGGAALIGGDTAVPGVSYHWLPTAGLTNPNAAQTFASPTVTTTYTLRVVNDSMETKSCGCPDSVTIDNVTVIVMTERGNVCCNASIVAGQAVQLNASGGTRYAWVPPTSCDTCPNPMASPAQTTIYTVTITNDSGCSTTRTVTIDVTCGQVFIPDLFSPNEAHNNILYVRGDCIATMDFMVFDRWGNKVFESQKQSVGWDGTYKGQVMNTGTYIWYLKATLNDGTNVEKKGNVALVR